MTEARYKKPHFVRFQIYEMFRTGTLIEAESKLVASRAWEDEGIGRYMVSLGDDGNILELDSGWWLHNILNTLKATEL